MNPLIIMYARTRLRPGDLVTNGGFVLVVCVGLTTLAFIPLGPFGVLTALWFLSGIQLVTVSLASAFRIARVVSAIRETGLIDFHRITPQTPLQLVSGLMFGIPIREIFQLAIILPFSLICHVLAAYKLTATSISSVPIIQGMTTFLVTTVCIVASGLAANACTLAISLMGPSGQKQTDGRAWLVIMVLGLLISGFHLLGIASESIPPGRFFEEISTRGQIDGLLTGQYSFYTLFGQAIPNVIAHLIFTIPIGGFALIAAIRKIRNQAGHCLSKPIAIIFQAWLALLIASLTLRVDALPLLAKMLIPSMALMIVGIGLSLCVSPDLFRVLKGYRRARHQGDRGVAPLADEQFNRVALLVLSAITLLGGALPLILAQTGQTNVPPVQIRTLAGPIVAALSVLNLGLLWQFTRVRYRARLSASLFGGIGALLFLIPLLVAWTIGSTLNNDSIWMACVSTICPVYGVPLASVAAVGSDQMVRNISEVTRSNAPLASLGSALALTLLFGFLELSGRRWSRLQLQYADREHERYKSHKYVPSLANEQATELDESSTVEARPIT